MVTVLLFGLVLRDTVGESEFKIAIDGSTTVKTLIQSDTDRLSGLLPFMNTGELLVSVNHKVGSLDSVIRDGDTLKLTHQSHPTYEGATWQNP
jgi:molybdopterin synthase sulfur carrier subunit